MHGSKRYPEGRNLLFAVSFSTKNCFLETSPGLRLFLLTGLLVLKGTMASSAFIIDYSGGTAGESHPVPFFQIQQLA